MIWVNEEKLMGTKAQKRYSRDMMKIRWSKAMMGLKNKVPKSFPS